MSVTTFSKNDNVYPLIEFGSITASSFEKMLVSRYSQSKIVIMVDENTHDYCLEYLITSFDVLKEAEVMLLPAGEENKVMEVCFQVWEAMSEYQIGRKDLVINLGGGVVTDMGGFIASVFKRGVDFINIPTSLLGMVDASVGGKTGIDLGAYKNQIGTITQPIAVLIDPGFLSTLPEEELLNGYAEMLKHTLITDRDKFIQLSNLEGIEDLINVELIKQSVTIKNDIVLSDPFEKGIRKVLNFGHTIGHAIEGYLLPIEPVPHGLAVAAGMLIESFIGSERGILSKDEFILIEEVLISRFPKIEIDKSALKEIIQLCLQDKKNEANKISCTLLNGIGKPLFDQFLTIEEIEKGLSYYIEL
ncbi:MAG: 3-dehydroquinate synthase [Flavobacteriia bacterium]